MWQILPISIRYISGSIVSSITLKIEHNLGSGHQLRGGGRLKTGGGRGAHEVLPLQKKGGGSFSHPEGVGQNKGNFNTDA